MHHRLLQLEETAGILLTVSESEAVNHPWAALKLPHTLVGVWLFGKGSINLTPKNSS